MSGPIASGKGDSGRGRPIGRFPGLAPGAARGAFLAALQRVPARQPAPAAKLDPAVPGQLPEQVLGLVTRAAGQARRLDGLGRGHPLGFGVADQLEQREGGRGRTASVMCRTRSSSRAVAGDVAIRGVLR